MAISKRVGPKKHFASSYSLSDKSIYLFSLFLLFLFPWWTTFATCILLFSFVRNKLFIIIIKTHRNGQLRQTVSLYRNSTDKFKGFFSLVGSGMSRPLMLLWKSWGKMPLGASWWNIQRRNCLATPATFPGINILQNRQAVLDRQSHFTSIIKLSHKHSERQCERDSFNVSYLSACPEKLALDANLKEVKAAD